MKFRQDIVEGDYLPEQWLSWGKVRPMNDYAYAPTLDYFQLRLPSFDMRELWHYDNRMSWHQLVFHYSSHGEWFDAGKRWHPGATLHWGFFWVPVGEPIPISEGMK